MLINRRNAMLGGKRLPYDAEVEYLESTGTQYIDTGIVLQSSDEIATKINILNNYQSIIFGSRTSVNSQNIGCGISGALELLVDVSDGDYGRYRAITSTNVPLGIYEISASMYERKISGAVSARNTTTSSEFAVPDNCYLFYGSGNFWTTSRFIGRFYYFRVLRNGALVRDFIPVRFMNEQGVSEGAFFDRANPTVGMNPDGSARTDGLYRNRGTGAFGYGSDKARSASAANGGGV